MEDNRLLDSRTNEQRAWTRETILEYPHKRGEGGEWTVNGREVWKGKYGLVVNHDSVTRPDGKKGVYEFVEIKPGVGILPVDFSRNVYLAQGFQYGSADNVLEVCGGGLDEGETPIDAARRELKEELGIKAKKLVDFGKSNPITGLIKTDQTIFMAEDIEIGDSNQENTEKILPVRVPLEDAVQMVRDRQIQEGQTRAAIMQAHDYFINPDLYRNCVHEF